MNLAALEALPIKVNSGTRDELEAMGIEYVEQVDDLFWYVCLPDGWRKEPTDHSMWSNLLDGEGRKRASVFCKAAFYDRDAFININRRFSYSIEPVGGWENYGHEDCEWHGVVKDNDMVIWETPEKLSGEPRRGTTDDESHRREWLAWCDRKDALGNPARAWLEEYYPDWQNRLAYWD